MEWLIAIGFLGAMGGFYAYVSHLERKRKEALGNLVRELGLELNWQLFDADLARFQRFEISKKGRLPTTGASIVADDGETRMVIFDYSYTTGHGKHKRSHLYGMAMCSNSSLKMPSFSVEPETWKSVFKGLFGYSDIAIQDDPEFSKAFSLQGEDPAAIRTFLTPQRRAVLAQFPNQQVSCKQDTLLIMRKHVRLKAENVKSLMADAFKLTNALMD